MTSLFKKLPLGFEALIAPSVKVADFWAIAPCSLGGGRTHLWNVRLLQRDYTALYPKRLSLLNITCSYDCLGYQNPLSQMCSINLDFLHCNDSVKQCF
jgi:hypothetical protein